MAAGAGIAARKSRRRGTLNFLMDELHGCKIAFSVQQNNRKDRCKKNKNNPVHSPRNVEIPNDRWNGHTAKLQNHTAGVRNDLRALNAAACGSTLTEEGRKKLCDKRKGGQASERNKAICEEVEKLVNAGIMKEVRYHSWLSNPVMVKKHDNSWRIYVDFKDLNKACLKDGYPLPEIDWKVESLCGYPFKYFLDAYKGYHQIKMAKEDEEKTAFITSQGIFCYSKMPF
ncbi:hypothetical protein Tco_0438423 [Tanacetum coccineum]